MRGQVKPNARPRRDLAWRDLAWFAGLDVYTCTLASNFRAPLLREYCLLHGLRSVERRAMQRILSRQVHARTHAIQRHR